MEGYWAEFDGDGDFVEESEPHDTHYHGTHVSGTVGARNEEYEIWCGPGGDTGACSHP